MPTTEHPTEFPYACRIRRCKLAAFWDLFKLFWKPAEAVPPAVSVMPRAILGAWAIWKTFFVRRTCFSLI